MRRVLLIGVGALVAVALVGWVVIGANARMLGQLRDGADRAAALAAELHGRPGVHAATARYDPLDGSGASVHVRVSMRASASISQWAAVTRLLGARLSTGQLAGLRQFAQIRGAGPNGGDLRFEDADDWPAASAQRAWFKRWERLRAVSGARIRLLHSARSGALAGFLVASAEDSRRFMSRIAMVNPLLSSAFVEGYGFTASGPAPKGAAAVYRALLREHDPAKPLATSLPSRPTGLIAWGPGSLSLALASPRTQATPSSSDARLVVALNLRAAATPVRSASWVNGSTVSTVELTRCASGTRTATVHDRAFAAALAGVGHPLRAPAGVGVCGN